MNLSFRSSCNQANPFAKSRDSFPKSISFSLSSKLHDDFLPIFQVRIGNKSNGEEWNKGINRKHRIGINYCFYSTTENHNKLAFGATVAGKSLSGNSTFSGFHCTGPAKSLENRTGSIRVLVARDLSFSHQGAFSRNTFLVFSDNDVNNRSENSSTRNVSATKTNCRQIAAAKRSGDLNYKSTLSERKFSPRGYVTVRQLAGL